MIEVSHLCKSYQGKAALSDVSFSVDTGSICGLLGPNGAGKSTTMNIMTGCLAATSGEVRYDGLEIYENMRDAKRAIGYLPEMPPVYPEMTVYEYLEFVGRAKGLSPSLSRAEAEQMAFACGLTEVYERLIKNLSKGYRQRVGIAQALVADPRYVILDEPTVGLDPVQIVEIRDLIHRLAGERTVLVSSHILSEIRTLCDRIIMIAHGRVVADDTPANLEQTYATGRRSVTVSVLAPPEELRAALCSLGGIDASRVEVSPGDEPGSSRAVVTVKGEGDPRPAISRALLERDLPVIEMAASKASLEDVFIELVEQSEHMGAPASDRGGEAPC